MKKAFYCTNPNCNHGKGNMLVVMGDERIFIRHRNPEGNYWEEITVRIPGILINFSNAAITQKLLPENFLKEKPPVCGGNKIFVKCPNYKCGHWTEITVSFPGIDLDLCDSATVRRDLPVGYHLDIEPASVVEV